MNPVEELAIALIRKHGSAACDRAFGALVLAIHMNDAEGMALLDATVRELSNRDWEELVPGFNAKQHIDQTVRRLLEED